MRRVFACVVATALIQFTGSCSADTLTTGPGVVSKVTEFVITSDSLVVLGGSLPIIVQGSLSSLPATVSVVWSTSDATVATVDVTGKVKGVGIGSVRISARLLSPDLDTSIVRSLDFRVKYKGIAVGVLDSLTGLGQTLTPLVQGLDSSGVVRGFVAATLSSSDPSVISAAAATLTAVKNGTATITATFDGATTQTSVKVRQVAKSVTLASAPLVFPALERDTTVAVTVRDTRDNVMTVTPTWTAVNAAAASVNAGVLRAHQAVATSFRVSVDTVTATLPVSVSQVIATIAKAAGDAQSQAAGSAVAIAPAISVKDAGGAGIAGVSVTFSVLTGGGAVATGTALTSATGIATPGSWTLGTVAGANSLSAVIGSVTQMFTATGTPGAPFRVRFTSSPAGTYTNLAGTTLAPSVSANVLDANGNVATPGSTTIRLALIGPAGTASLDGTTSLASVAGVAAYGSLKASAPSASYRLVASATGLASDTTAAFTVLGPPAKLAFVAQPATAASSVTLPIVTVAVQDAAGTTLSAASNSVALAIGANPGGASLSGGAAASPVAGIASFTGLSLNKAGTGYSFTATSTGLTSAVSGAFNIGPAGASSLSFLVAPTSVSNTAAMTPGVQVAVTDADGNTVTSATGTITAIITSGTGATVGNATAPIAGGIATFGSLSLTGAVGTFTLKFADGTRSLMSAPITLGAGAATALVFGTAPPAVATNGTPLASQPVVRVVDVSGNTVTTASGTVTATIESGTGGTLAVGTAPIVNGVASFTGLALNGIVGAYTLRFSDGGRTVTSGSLTLNAGAPAALAISTPLPTTSMTGVALPLQPVIRVVDASGNTVTSATGTMTATIASGPGGLLTGATAPIVAGIATFSTLTLSGPGAPFTLAFSDGAVNVTSSPVALSSPASVVIVSTLSATTTNGAILPVQPVVKVVDGGGATVTSATGTVTASIVSGSGAVLRSSTTLITAGVATFTALELRGLAGNFTLQFSDGTRTVTSGTITLGPGTAAALQLTAAPSAMGTNGLPLGTQPVVTVRDISGNVVTTASGAMTAAITSGSGSILSGATASIANGVATFNGLTFTGTAGDFTLGFSDGTRTVASGTITIGSSAAASIAFVPGTGPSATATNGIALSVQPSVKILDVSGNIVTSATGLVTATILTGTRGTLVNATAPIAGGIAAFTTLGLNGTAGAFMLRFSDGVRTVNSSTITLTTGAASAVAITSAPVGTATNGVALATQPVVKVVDASGNVLASASGTMTASIAGGSGGVLVNATASITGGVATFSGLTLNGTAGTFTLRFSDGPRSTVSGNIALAAGAANAITFTSAPPIAATSGVPFSAQPTVRIVDIGGNTVNVSGTITATVATGTGVMVNQTAALIAGVASFTSLTLNGTPGSFTLELTDGTRSITSGTLVLSASASSGLAFVAAPPMLAANGVNFATQPIVRVVDAEGVTIATSGSMTATIFSGPPATLTASTTPIVAGVATFSGMCLTGAAGNYTLQFSDGTRTIVSGPILLGLSSVSALPLSTPPSIAGAIELAPGTQSVAPIAVCAPR